jgi:aspartate racemase
VTDKTVGILGGMGPEATADLFMKIVKATPAKKDQEHLRVVMDSNPKIPDRTAFILGKGDDPRPLLLSGARNVERLGASFIVIPCNTAHYFYKDISEAVNIPVLNIMDEVARYLSGKVLRAGLLASTGTLITRLYENALGRCGIATLVPQGPDQDEVMKAIYSVKAGDLDTGRRIALEQGRKLLAAGAQAVIAGCTEIPLVLKADDLEVPTIDATTILAQAAVRFATAKTPGENQGK